MEEKWIAPEKEIIKIAVCGDLPTTCEQLKREEDCQIEHYTDASSLAFRMRDGEEYDIILVYAPQGEGLLDTSYPYKKKTEQEWKQVPIRLLDEPACQSALSELKRSIHKIRTKARKQKMN